MSQQSVTKAYSLLLTDLGCEFVEMDNGLHQIIEPTKTVNTRRKPMALSGVNLPVVLPSKEALKEHTPDAHGNYPFIIFHPAFEQRDHDESPTLKKLNQMVRHNLHYKFLYMLGYFSNVLANSKMQDSLKANQLKPLKSLSSVINTKTAEFITNVLKQSKASNVARLTLVPTKSSRSVHDGENVEALYLLVSPLLKELVMARDGKADKVWGVKVTAKAHVDGFIKLIHHFLPELEGGVYDQSSTSRIAPKFECITKMYADVSAKLDKVLRLYPEYQEEILGADKLPLTELGWVEELSNLSAVKNTYPSLPGNGQLTAASTATVSVVDENKQTIKETVVSKDKPNDDVTELLEAAGYNTKAAAIGGNNQLKPIGQAAQAAKPKTITIDGETYVLEKEAGKLMTAQSQGLVLGQQTNSQPLTLGGASQQQGGLVLGGGQQGGGLVLNQAPKTHTYIDTNGQIQTVVQATISR